MGSAGTVSWRGVVIIVAATVGITGCYRQDRPQATAVEVETGNLNPRGGGEQALEEYVFPVQKTETEWRAQLTEEQYHVLRQGGTECAFSGEFWNRHEDGVYHCAGCGNPLFDARTKYESGTGWPSFYDTVARGAVIERSDRSHGRARTEVLCSQCGGHLGHVFQDGPPPTGLRYCINSAALVFRPREISAKESAEP